MEHTLSEKAPLIQSESSDKKEGGEDSENLSGEWRTFINITKGFVGAASFELPWAFMQAGFIGSLAGVVVLALLSYFALGKLAICGRLVEGKQFPTYPTMAYKACGPFGAFAAWFGCAAMTLGTCGAYIVFISSVWKELATNQKGFEGWSAEKHTVVWTAATCLVLIPFSWLRTYRFMAITSSFGVTALSFALIFTLWDCIHHYEVKIDRNIPMMRTDSYPLFLGNAAFLYLMSTAIMPLEQNMKKREKFHRPFGTSILVVTVVNIAFGFTAYLAYGDCNQCMKDSKGEYAADCCTQGNVMTNLKVKAPHVLYVVTKVCLAVDLFFTCMLFLFPMSELFEKAIFKQEAFGQRKIEYLRNLLRACIVVVIGLIAQGIPEFSLLTGLSGGFGNNIIGFVLPPIFYSKLRYDQGYWKPLTVGGIFKGDRKAGSLFLEALLLAVSFLFGTTVLVLSTYSFSDKIAKHQTS